MAKEYLDKTGLSYFWGKIKSHFQPKYAVGSYYETSDSTFDPNTAWSGTWVSETITDNRIVEQGTSGFWKYRKWSNGTAECWGYKLTSGPFSAWGSGYSHDIPVQAYPANLFSEVPVSIAVAKCASGNAVMGLGNSGGTKDNTPAMTVYRATNLSGNPNFLTFYYAAGVWKSYTTPTTIYRWHRTA